jgi:1-deoxy-D-xylulose-5-phosphate synthase
VMKAVEGLSALGINATVADARFCKPLDTQLVEQLASNHRVLITIEEGAIGGFGSHVAQHLAEAGVFDNGLIFRSMFLPDTFQDHDSPQGMYVAAGMSAGDIEVKVIEALGAARIPLPKLG